MRHLIEFLNVKIRKAFEFKYTCQGLITTQRLLANGLLEKKLPHTCSKWNLHCKKNRIDNLWRHTL